MPPTGSSAPNVLYRIALPLAVPTIKLLYTFLSYHKFITSDFRGSEMDFRHFDIVCRPCSNDEQKDNSTREKYFLASKQVKEHSDTEKFYL